MRLLKICTKTGDDIRLVSMPMDYDLDGEIYIAFPFEFDVDDKLHPVVKSVHPCADVLYETFDNWSDKFVYMASCGEEWHKKVFIDTRFRLECVG